MSFLAPGFLVAAVAAACGVIALHFIVTRRPRAHTFPTARFVPEAPTAARVRSIQLSDLSLLVIRILTILLAGAALARPIFPLHRERIARVIAADVSGAVASLKETRDSVRILFRPGDAIVVFDTAARSIVSPESIAVSRRTPRSGSISTALVAALRAGAGVKQGADSVELVIVSPVTSSERDRATKRIRALWPGRARLVQVTAESTAKSLLPRAQLSNFLSTARPPFAVARSQVDTASAAVMQNHVIVASFERRWRFTAESLGRARVIARWADGEPAAIERDSALGCVRSVAIPIDSAGDLLLRPSVIQFRASLDVPCRSAASKSDTALRNMLIGTGRLARSAQFSQPADIESPLSRWLAALAIVLAIVDILVRRMRTTEAEE